MGGTIIAILLSSSALALLHFVRRYGREDYNNPWLMVSPWRPLVTEVIPLFWAVVLIARRGRWSDSASPRGNDPA